MVSRKWLISCWMLLPVLHLAAQEEAPVNLLRGPYLQSATSNGIVLRWRTDVATRSRVLYGSRADALTAFVNDSAITNEHIVTLAGLQPLTRYYYAIETFDRRLQGDADNYFYTLPTPGKEGRYRIGVLGDCGNNSVNQQTVKDQVLKYIGDSIMHAWLLLGDNAYNSGTDAEYQAKFFNVYKNDLLKKYPLFPVPGNHDYNDHDFPGAVEMAQLTHATPYYQNFSMPVNGEAGGVPSHTQAFYSFDVGNIHFLALDSYGKEANQFRLYDTLGPQVQWVKQDLAANTNKQWVVAYWHHPPYTMGSHNSDTETELIKIRENFIGILERAGVDLVLCGHSHDYERSRLMKGHVGLESSFSAAQHNLSNSSGRYDSTANACPYIKDSTNQGTVYVVSGSAGKLGGEQKTFPHDAMEYSNAHDGGATVLEVEGNRLDLTWICADGVIRDRFTMMKNVNRKVLIPLKKGQRVTLTASYVGYYQWSQGRENSRSVKVSPGAGTTTYTVQDKIGCIKDTFIVKVIR